MKLYIFSVYDKAVQAYVSPFYSRSKGEAIRSFTEACNDEKNNLSRHAADYSLMFLGEFDDVGGVFSPVDPVRIVSALECVLDTPFTKETEDRGKVTRLPM